MEIKKISALQADELCSLAKAIYKEHYLHLWEPEGAEWYQEVYAYEKSKLQAELSDPNNLHFVVYEDAKPLGYLKLRIDATLKDFESFNSIEIERIYLHQHAAGNGIGKQLMQLSEQIAIEHHKQMIFLKAMDTSLGAIAFYQKMGYTICGNLVLPFEQMKPEFRGMLILNKRI